MIISNITTTTLKLLAQGTLDLGKLLYIDRIYAFTNIPTKYNSMPYILTSNDDRYLTTVNYLQFDINVDAKMYIAFDNLNTVPAWLNDFVNTGETIVRDETRPYTIYSKEFSAGHITLPGSSILSTDGGGAYIIFFEEGVCNPSACDFTIAQSDNGSTLASIQISPVSASVSLNGTQTMTATCYDQNGNVISCPLLNWNSSVPNVASIISIISTGNNTALVTGLDIGTTEITASGT